MRSPGMSMGGLPLTMMGDNQDRHQAFDPLAAFGESLQGIYGDPALLGLSPWLNESDLPCVDGDFCKTLKNLRGSGWADFTEPEPGTAPRYRSSLMGTRLRPGINTMATPTTVNIGWLTGGGGSLPGDYVLGLTFQNCGYRDLPSQEMLLAATDASGWLGTGAGRFSLRNQAEDVVNWRVNNNWPLSASAVVRRLDDQLSLWFNTERIGPDQTLPVNTWNLDSIGFDGSGAFYDTILGGFGLLYPVDATIGTPDMSDIAMQQFASYLSRRGGGFPKLPNPWGPGVFGDVFDASVSLAWGVLPSGGYGYRITSGKAQQVFDVNGQRGDWQSSSVGVRPVVEAAGLDGQPCLLFTTSTQMTGDVNTGQVVLDPTVGFLVGFKARLSGGAAGKFQGPSDVLSDSTGVSKIILAEQGNAAQTSIWDDDANEVVWTNPASLTGVSAFVLSCAPGGAVTLWLDGVSQGVGLGTLLSPLYMGGLKPNPSNAGGSLAVRIGPIMQLVDGPHASEAVNFSNYLLTH